MKRMTLMQARVHQKGWTQAELAAKSGVGQQTISDLEAGKKEPRYSTVEALEKALGLKRGQLVFGGQAEVA